VIFTEEDSKFVLIWVTSQQSPDNSISSASSFNILPVLLSAPTIYHATLGGQIWSHLFYEFPVLVGVFSVNTLPLLVDD
jgi:hypothetical protein